MKSLADYVRNGIGFVALATSISMAAQPSSVEFVANYISSHGTDIVYKLNEKRVNAKSVNLGGIDYITFTSDGDKYLVVKDDKKDIVDKERDGKIETGVGDKRVDASLQALFDARIGAAEARINHEQMQNKYNGIQIYTRPKPGEPH